MKLILSIRAVILALATVLLLGYAVGHCAIPPGTPNDVMCSAELDSAACSKFQAILILRGYGSLRVLEGTAFGTVGDLKKMTYLVVLKCLNPKDFICVVKIAIVRNKAGRICVEPTSERRLPA